MTRILCPLIASLLMLSVLAGCEKPQVEPEAKNKGGDYLSTTFRARERAIRQLNDVNAIRKEQVQEEKDFDSKSTPAPAKSE